MSLKSSINQFDATSRKNCPPAETMAPVIHILFALTRLFSTAQIASGIRILTSSYKISKLYLLGLLSFATNVLNNTVHHLKRLKTFRKGSANYNKTTFFHTL